MHAFRPRAGLLLGLLLAAPRVADACAFLYEEDTKVQVDGEGVLIVWDAEAQREHLIRHIGFRGNAEDFGFLGPVPSEPGVAEVECKPFETLFPLYRRPQPRSRSREVRCSGGAIGLGSMVGDVEGVAEHHVAGQTAMVLRATDAEALDRWLGDNRYPSGPALERPLGPAVAATRQQPDGRIRNWGLKQAPRTADDASRELPLV